MSSRRPCTIAIALAFALVLAACSSDSDGQATDPPESTGAPSSTTAPDRSCDQGATMDAVEAARVDDPKTPNDWTITSFDGTAIRAHWFPLDTATADEPVPTVLMGPGWSLAGDTSETGDALFGGMSIPSLQDAGYNVLTWDPRGFGKSEGTVRVNDPAFEGRDAQTLLDWVATQPESMLDGEGDPRVGMVGASYGGGIQLTLAAMDCRVDALVPTIAWNSIERSLFRNETVKIGWAGTLLSAAAGRDLDPHLQDSFDQGTATGTVSEENLSWYRSKDPAVEDVRTPTLLLQGTVDTLFTLDEAIVNYRLLQDAEVPTAMLWFCGGHGVCLTEAGDTSRSEDATFAWLRRYLDDDESVDLGPAFSTVDQEGTTWSASDLPASADEKVTATGEGTLAITDASASGPAVIPPEKRALLGGLVSPITPGPAAEAVEVPIEMGDIDGLALGAPELTLTYAGTMPDGERPARIFAQLVDEDLDVVVGNLATPIPLTLDGSTQSTSIDLESVSQRVGGGRTLTLQLVATTVSYSNGRLGGEVSFDNIELTLPVVTTGLTEG